MDTVRLDDGLMDKFMGIVLKAKFGIANGPEDLSESETATLKEVVQTIYDTDKARGQRDESLIALAKKFGFTPQGETNEQG